MTQGEIPVVRISVATDRDVPSALRRVLRLEGDVADVPSLAAEVVDLPRHSSNRPLVAWQGERVVGVAWIQSLLPSICSVWKPYAENRPAREALYRELDRRLTHPPVQLARCMLASDDLNTAARFRAIGFNDMAIVESMVWIAGPVADLSQQLQLVPVDDDRSSMRQRLRRVMAATYENSLDCPSITDALTADQALECYARSGPSVRNHWYLASQLGVDVGCIILRQDIDDEQLTLAYIGIDSDHRRNGFGSELVVRAQCLCRQLACRRMVLSVDSANTPAIQMYRRLGFLCYESRMLLARLNV